MRINGQRGIDCFTNILTSTADGVNTELDECDLQQWKITNVEDSLLAKLVIMIVEANFIQSLSFNQYKDADDSLKIRDQKAWEEGCGQRKIAV